MVWVYLSWIRFTSNHLIITSSKNIYFFPYSNSFISLHYIVFICFSPFYLVYRN